MGRQLLMNIGFLVQPIVLGEILKGTVLLQLFFASHFCFGLCFISLPMLPRVLLTLLVLGIVGLFPIAMT